MSRAAVTGRRPIEEVYAGAEYRRPTRATVRTVGQTVTLRFGTGRSPPVATVRTLGQVSGTVTVSG